MDNLQLEPACRRKARFKALKKDIKQLKLDAKQRKYRYKKDLKTCQSQRQLLITELIAARKELPVNNGKIKKSKIKMLRMGTGTAPLNIFPLEVWCRIFDNLTSLQDLDSCSHASPDFKKELTPKLLGYHFQQVFPILINSGTLKNDLFKSLLKMRKICRTWKAEVDTFLESHPCHYHLDESCTRRSNIYSPFSTLVDCYQANLHYTFSSLEKLHQFSTLADELGGEGSVFHGRTLRLDDSNMYSPEDRFNVGLRSFWDAAEILLEKVGADIWHLELNSFDVEYDLTLCDMLHLVPNLKVLNITFRGNYDNLNTMLPAGVGVMPTLSKLEVLKITVGNYGFRCVECLMKANSHIKKLGLDYNSSCTRRKRLRTHNNGSLDRKYKHPNLEALKLPQLYSRMHEREIVQLRKFVKRCSPSSLQTISLDFPDAPKSGNFLSMLAKLQMKAEIPPLKTLNLKIKDPITAEFTLPLLRQFSGLENLTIDARSCTGMRSIDFLFLLKSLKRLTIIGVDLKNGAESEMADKNELIMGLDGTLYESNVWKLLPNLEYVLFKDGNQDGGWLTRYYDRSGYDSYWNRKLNAQ